MMLEAILRAVPQEMLSTLAVKQSAKDAWDAIKIMRMGVDQVRKAKAQQLCKQFEAMAFHDGETVDDFAMRLTGLVNSLSILGDPVDEPKIVEKFLRVVPPKFSQIALSIETLLDVGSLSIEEVTCRLKAAEERLNPGGGANDGGKLLLTAEEWVARLKARHTGKAPPASRDRPAATDAVARRIARRRWQWPRHQGWRPRHVT